MNESTRQTKAARMNAVLDGLPDDMILCGRAETAAAAPVRRENAFLRFISSPTAAVILSVCIAFGVVFAIIMAGRGDGGKPVVPHWADSLSESETEMRHETVTNPQETEVEEHIFTDSIRLIPSYSIAVLPAGKVYTELPADGLTWVTDIFPIDAYPGDEILFSVSFEKDGEPFVPEQFTLYIRNHDTGLDWHPGAIYVMPDGRRFFGVSGMQEPAAFDLRATIPIDGQTSSFYDVIFEGFMTILPGWDDSVIYEPTDAEYTNEAENAIRFGLSVRNTGSPLTTMSTTGTLDGIINNYFNHCWMEMIKADVMDGYGSDYLPYYESETPVCIRFEHDCSFEITVTVPTDDKRPFVPCPYDLQISIGARYRTFPRYFTRNSE